MTDLPSYDLELKAANERRRLQDSVTELRYLVRDSLDVKQNVRRHLALVCTGVAVVGLSLGYLMTGAFTSR
jgi:hypothetical protein